MSSLVLVKLLCPLNVASDKQIEEEIKPKEFFLLLLEVLLPSQGRGAVVFSVRRLPVEGFAGRVGPW